MMTRGTQGYQQRLRSHLEEYRRQTLKISEPVLRSINKKEQSYYHILPKERERANIVPSLNEEFWQWFDASQAKPGQRIRLHRDFSHLNSSQAFAFNFFFAILGSVHAEPQLLFQDIDLAGESLKNWRFEFVADSREGTNFDVMIELQSGSRILVEVKLSEAGFGKCASDKGHLKKLADVYTSRLTTKVDATYLDPPVFFANYQMMRNLSDVDDASTYIMFFHLRANASLGNVRAFANACLRETLRGRIIDVAFEDMLSRLLVATATGNPKLNAILTEIGNKYAPPALREGV
jgi:hypothetical protein